MKTFGNSMLNGNGMALLELDERRLYHVHLQSYTLSVSVTHLVYTLTPQLSGERRISGCNQVHTHTHTHTHTQTHIHTHTHTHKDRHIHTHTHTYTHTYIHTHIHTHIHT